MSIGEKIIAAIEDGKLQSMEDVWGGVKISFKPNAAEQLEAVVEAHIEERVRIRLELDKQNDTARLNWLERNLMTIHTPTAPDMSGVRFVGQLRNEARGQNGGPSYCRVASRTLRGAIDQAMNWSPIP